MTRGPGRNGSRWRRAQAACMARGEAEQTPCSRCGQPIDYALTRAYPRHRLAGTADHVQELWMGGDPVDPDNLAPMHRGCNAAKSNQIRGLLRYRQVPIRPPPTSSRQW